MTSTRRERRSISLAPSLIEQSPTPPAQEQALAEPAPSKTKAGTPRKTAAGATAGLDAPAKPARTRAARKATEPLPEPAMVTPTLRQGEETFAEAAFKLTAQIPESLHKRASGVVMHARMTGEPEGIASLTDLVISAMDIAVTQYEQELNNGQPWPAPLSLPRGRRPRA